MVTVQLTAAATANAAGEALTQTYVGMGLGGKSFSFMYPSSWGTSPANSIIAVFLSSPVPIQVAGFPVQMASSFAASTSAAKKTKLRIGNHDATRLEGDIHLGGSGIAYSFTLANGSIALVYAQGTPDAIKPIEPTMQAVLATMQVPAAS